MAGRIGTPRPPKEDLWRGYTPPVPQPGPLKEPSLLGRFFRWLGTTGTASTGPK